MVPWGSGGCKASWMLPWQSGLPVRKAADWFWLAVWWYLAVELGKGKLNR